VSLEIDIQDETNELTENQIKLVRDILNYAAKFEETHDNSEVTVTFVDNEAIKSINLEYRNIDKATDVISFALNDDESDKELVKGIPNLLGDIIISYPKTIQQAKEYGHSVERELGFLLVHGFLHLLGYDHINKEDEDMMFKRQEEILEAYGLQK
jgi:probable rRNA maturation factor